MRAISDLNPKSVCIQARLIDKFFTDSKKSELITYCENILTVLHPLDCFFFRAKYLNYTAIILSFYDNDVISGVVLLYQKKILTLPTGVYVSPYECGYCSYIGKVEDKLENLRRAASIISNRLLFAKLVIHAEYDGIDRAEFKKPFSKNQSALAQTQSKGSYFLLKQIFEETIKRFSQKSRKNLRHYRRVAEIENGCRYIDNLNVHESLAAVKILNAFSSRSMGHSSAARRCRITRLFPGGFSAGLIDKDGNWLSYISAWRKADTTYIDWQINKENSNRFSYSTAMRSFFIENEIALGAKAVFFLGGATPTWENACNKHEILRITMCRSGRHARLIGFVFAVIAKFRPLDRTRKALNKLLLILLG